MCMYTLLAQRAHDPHSLTHSGLLSSVLLEHPRRFFVLLAGRSHFRNRSSPPFAFFTYLLVGADLGEHGPRPPRPPCRNRVSPLSHRRPLTAEFSTSDWFCDSWQEFARNPIEVTVVVFLQFPM